MVGCLGHKNTLKHKLYQRKRPFRWVVTCGLITRISIETDQREMPVAFFLLPDKGLINEYDSILSIAAL